MTKIFLKLRFRVYIYMQFRSPGQNTKQKGIHYGLIIRVVGILSLLCNISM